MDGGADRFEAFVDAVADVIGHADRVRPLRDYCTGLLTPAERKSVEPPAAVTAPSRVSAPHQSLLRFVAQSPWSDARVLARVLELTLPSITSSEPIEAWIIDDTSFPKKGKHSVGVTRQYSGQLGKQDNCQVAVSLSVANAAASLPIAYRLYLPKDWAADPDRRKKAGVPEEVTFKTKPEIALDQIRAALDAGVPSGVVLMDAGYGADTSLRSAITELGLAYVAGIQPHSSVWTRRNPPPPVRPPVRPWSGRGRPTRRMVRDADHQPRSAEDVARSLPAEAWQTISWREGSADVLSSRFARVRAAQRDDNRNAPRDEEWLVLEWPPEQEKPSKFWLAAVPEDITFDRLVAGEAALAHRAGLPGTEAGTRSRALRGTGLAGFPPPRHPVHRGIRLPGRRTGEDSPLRIDASRHAAFSSRWFARALVLPSDRSGTS